MIILGGWGGRFGNNIIRYNNLRQVASLTSQPWRCSSWYGDVIFESAQPAPLHPTSIEMSSKTMCEIGEDELKLCTATNNIILNNCLGELFFKYTLQDPSCFLTTSFSSPPLQQVGVHMRGTDFFTWNPHAVLSTDYYVRAIETCLDDITEEFEVAIFTDDPTLQSFKRLSQHLNAKGISVRLGPDFGKPNRNHADSHPDNFLRDFKMMCQSSYLVSSPSTFCITAGFLGTQKKIVHSLEWVKSRADVDDGFWVDLLAGGNEFYKTWKLI